MNSYPVPKLITWKVHSAGRLMMNNFKAANVVLILVFSGTIYTGNRIINFTWHTNGTYELPVKESVACCPPTD